MFRVRENLCDRFPDFNFF